MKRSGRVLALLHEKIGVPCLPGEVSGWNYHSMLNISQCSDCQAMNNTGLLKSGGPLLISNAVCISGVYRTLS